MRHLAFVVAATGLLALAAPAQAGAASVADGIVPTQVRSQDALQQSRADEFSAQRHYRRHWHGHRHHWRGHRHWHRPHFRAHYGYGWNRCRTVWRPYAGWVRVCRW